MDVIIHLEMFKVTALLISSSNMICINRIVHRSIMTVAFLSSSLSLVLMALSIFLREMDELLTGSVYMVIYLVGSSALLEGPP